MPLPELSFLDTARIATAIVDAPNLGAAFELAAGEFSRLFGVLPQFYEKRDETWVRAADHPDNRTTDVPLVLRPLPTGLAALLTTPAGGRVTQISLTGPHGPPVAMVLDGDWTDSGEASSRCALAMSLALDAVRERDATRHAQRLLLRGYAMARRLGRLGSVDAVAQMIVEHVARLLNAERVSVALYHPAEDCLTIEAACGYPIEAVKDVRIQPGSWVIGHVHSSGRPVFVDDVRLLPGAADHRREHRTFAFAAVPMFAGSDTVGVLTVTDKRDGSPFNGQDRMLLRTLSAAAAAALVSARTDSEAARLAYAATVDSLTGLLNRPYLDTRLHQEVERAKRENSVLTVLMADIDNFKIINDTHGHQVGDAVLKAAGSAIRSAVRVFDVCARYGGDEFAILMPNSDQRSARACAERIRRRIAEYQIDAGDPLPSLTVSVGVAVIGSGDTAQDLIRRADQCLYEAKANGKNLVCVQASSPLARSTANTAEGRAPATSRSEAHHRTRSAESAAQPERRAPPYVLAADADPARGALYLEAIKPVGVGLLIARDADQAARVLDRFGPPLLMILDLSVASQEWHTLIENLRETRTEIIAWCSSREVREFAAANLGGQKVRVLASSSAPSVMRAAIERALRRTKQLTPAPVVAALADEDLDRTTAALADRARKLNAAPGVAVYMRSDASERFRASFSWTSEEMFPHSPYYLPRVLERIQETKEVLVWPDLTPRTPADEEAVAEDEVKGLVAVPVFGADRDLVGAVCVFDIAPLALSDSTMSALAAIGREAVPAASAKVLTPVPVDAADEGAAAESLAMRPFRDRIGDGRPRDDRAAPPTVDWPPALLDRTGGEFAVARELARARREQRQLSVVLFDIAPAGQAEEVDGNLDEELLGTVTDTLLKGVRQSDLPIQWGGGELLVVLPGLAGAGARSVAERVRAALQAGARHRVAVSGGVAELEANDTFGAVVDRARQRVERAREGGRNRVF
jgi:diguanylate cyclase (GGDEF)-like protein